MTNPKKYKNRYITTIPFEKQCYDLLNSYLPKGVSIADEINKFIDERGKELERESNNNVKEIIDNSPMNSVYNKGYNTTLDEYIRLYEDESTRFRNLYNMSQQEIYEYGKFLDKHLTEVCSIMFSRFKVSSFLNRKISHEVIVKSKNIVYGKNTSSSI